MQILFNSADLAEAAALVVDHRLTDLSGGVHDEWPVARDRLIQRNAADEQQFGSVLCCYRHCIAVALEDDGIVLTRRPRAKRYLSADDEREGVVRFGNRLRKASTRGEAHVEIHDRRARVDR